jgi:hypothetical protein
LEPDRALCRHLQGRQKTRPRHVGHYVMTEDLDRNSDFYDLVVIEPALALRVVDYVHPKEVLRDDRLDPAEKRTILSAWASDACAVKSRPGFRWLPGTPGPVTFNHVAEALQTLDRVEGVRTSAGRRRVGNAPSRRICSAARRNGPNQCSQSRRGVRGHSSAESWPKIALEPRWECPLWVKSGHSCPAHTSNAEMRVGTEISPQILESAH